MSKLLMLCGRQRLLRWCAAVALIFGAEGLLCGVDAAPPATQKSQQDLTHDSIPFTTDELSQYGITWNFETPVKCRKFVGGDYWVLGPVTIKDVTPGWDGTRNGSVVDPPISYEQGYSETWSKFNPKFSGSLRAKFPLKLEGVHSLVSTIGLEKPVNGGGFTGLDTVCVLTVVDKIPPKDAFRPPYVAGDKPIYTAAQLKWDRLPKLPKPEKIALPKFGTTMQRVWLDHSSLPGIGNVSLHPRGNMSVNAAICGLDVSNMSLLVMLDIPEREELTYRLVQLGIDLHPISLANEDGWRAIGDAGNGRKWPILFAGIMLGSDKMQAPPATADSSTLKEGKVDKFSEDGFTYYGKPTADYSKGKPLFGNTVTPEVYKMQLQNGLSNTTSRDPDGLADGILHRESCSKTWVGTALAARLMGAEETWNHPAFFSYVDRWVKEGGVAADNTDRDPPEIVSGCYGNPFVKYMWDTYRPKAEDIARKPPK